MPTFALVGFTIIVIVWCIYCVVFIKRITKPPTKEEIQQNLDRIYAEIAFERGATVEEIKNLYALGFIMRYF